MTSALKMALAYAQRGWHVFPLHDIDSNGQCSCGKAECGDNAGKHPRTAHGFKDATLDEGLIKTWWTRWPIANVGIATGKISGLFVLDVDPDHGGLDSLFDLTRDHGLIPDTIEQKTGGGGRHYLFAYDGDDLSIDTGKLGPGLDTRGNGGYICAPPSTHHSGGRYEWELSSLPSKTPLAPLPTWLINLLKKESPVPLHRNGSGPRTISQGERDATLASLAGTMRRKAMPETAIYAALVETNNEQCDPPLPDTDIKRISHSIARYEPLDQSPPVVDEAEPELVREGDQIIWLWRSLRIGIGFDNLRESSEGLHGEISVDTIESVSGIRSGHYHWGKFNLSSTRARSELNRALKDRNDSLNWPALIEEAVIKTVDIWREGEPIVDLATLEGPEDDTYLLGEFMPESETTVLFADGGSLKSYLALAVGLSVTSGTPFAGLMTPRKLCNVLYLDWEQGALAHRNRLRNLARGLGLPAPPTIYHRQMQRSISDDIAKIRRDVDHYKIGLVIVDSIGPACGGEPENAETILRAFNALRSLHPATRLVISHVSAAGAALRNGKARPFGSVFVTNMARSVWEVRRNEEGVNIVKLGLYHKKVNSGRLQEPLYLKVAFDTLNHTIVMSKDEMTETTDLVDHSRLSDRIRLALKQQSGTYDDLEKWVGANAEVIRKTMKDMDDILEVGRRGERSREKVWGIQGLIYGGASMALEEDVV